MTPLKQRRPLSWRNSLVLTAMWLLLWGSVHPFTIVGGIITSYIIMFVFPLPSLNFHGKFRLRHFAIFVFRFAIDLLVASFSVAWLAVRPQAPPKNSIIAVPLSSESDLILTITAEVISLIPGTVVVDASQEDHMLYLHVLGADTAEKIETTRRKMHEQEHRIVAAIGTDAELAKFGDFK